MGGYPVIYWVVVLIVAGAVSTVLMGIGYLQGRRAAMREAAQELKRLNASVVLAQYERRTTVHQGGAR